MATLPPAAERGKSGKTHSIVLPALGLTGRGKYTLAVTGDTLSIVAAPCRVRVRLDDGSSTDLRAGCSLDASNGSAFERVEFENTTDAEVVIVVYVGFARYRIDTSETVDAPTEAQGEDTPDLAAHTGRTFTGGSTGRFRQRRAAYVTNLSLSLDLQVRDLDGHVIVTVFPRQAYTLEISGSFEIFNPNSEGVPYQVGGSWYTELAR